MRREAECVGLQVFHKLLSGHGAMNGKDTSMNFSKYSPCEATR